MISVKSVNIDFIITAITFLPSILIKLDLIFAVGTSDCHRYACHVLLLLRLSLLLLKYTGNRLPSYNELVRCAWSGNDIMCYKSYFIGEKRWQGELFWQPIESIPVRMYLFISPS